MNEPLSMGRSHSASVDPSPRLSDDLTCLIIGHFLRQMVKFIQWLPLCDERIDTLQETPSIGDVIGGVVVLVFDIADRTHRIPTQSIGKAIFQPAQRIVPQ